MSVSFYRSDILLKRRDILDLVFNIEYPVHIGERQEGIVKKLLYFEVEGVEMPIIPAESLRGVFRHLATKIAKSIFDIDIVRCHNKDEHTVDNECRKIVERYIDEARDWIKKTNIISYEYIGRELSNRQTVELYLSYKCPICRLFGSKAMASKIIFTDTVFTAFPEVHTYTSTSIDRRIKTVAEKRLFRIEYIPPVSTYKLKTRVIIDNVDPGTYEAILLANLLRYIAIYGLQIGGSKSRGYGLLKLNDESKVISMRLNINPKSADDIRQNIRAILLKEDAIEERSIEEYYSYLSMKDVG